MEASLGSMDPTAVKEIRYFLIQTKRTPSPSPTTAHPAPLKTFKMLKPNKPKAVRLNLVPQQQLPEAQQPQQQQQSSYMDPNKLRQPVPILKTKTTPETTSPSAAAAAAVMMKKSELSLGRGPRAISSKILDRQLSSHTTTTTTKVTIKPFLPSPGVFSPQAETKKMSPEDEAMKLQRREHISRLLNFETRKPLPAYVEPSKLKEMMEETLAKKKQKPVQPSPRKPPASDLPQDVRDLLKKKVPIMHMKRSESKSSVLY
jgi:hypothetical protein